MFFDRTQQAPTRWSARDAELGARPRRARPGGLQAPAPKALGETRGRNDPGLFQRGVESPSSPPGEGLTTRDILEAQRAFDETGREIEGPEEEEEGPLGEVQLGMDQHINRQVMIVGAGFWS